MAGIDKWKRTFWYWSSRSLFQARAKILNSLHIIASGFEQKPLWTVPEKNCQECIEGAGCENGGAHDRQVLLTHDALDASFSLRFYLY